MVDSIPERTLYALRPLILDAFVNAPNEDDALSEDEIKLLEQCRKDWKETPESFISIAEYKKRRKLDNNGRCTPPA
jgi:hypothetical protein